MNSDELIDTKKRARPLGFLRSGRDAARNKMRVLHPLVHDPALYDVVALGTLVWNGLMSSPMRTYITINKSRFNRFAFFCTQGGGATRIKSCLAICKLYAGGTPSACLRFARRWSKMRSITRGCGNLQALCRRVKPMRPQRRKIGTPATSRLAFLKRLFYSVSFRINLWQWNGGSFCGL